MIVFNLINKKFRAKIEMINGGDMDAFIDTGSPISVISMRDLSMITGYEESHIVNFVENLSGVNICGFTGGSVNMIPITIRNCTVGGIYFHALYFLLNTDTKQKGSLFGLDFITSFGSISGNYTGPMILDNPSVEFYRNHFVEFCGSDTIHEISSLDSKSSIGDLLKRAEG